MSGPDLPETPVLLKSIQPYLKTASEHDKRDPIISYWCRLYALQVGLKLSTKTSEETNFLLKLMDWLEVTKKLYHENEAITNDVAAQAHIENWALKLFLYADKNDRASNFGKNVIQSFYTAGLLYDVLTTFGDLSEEAGQNRKYAKWKAAYIHNCLKNGETPIPGPIKDGNNDSNENDDSLLAENDDKGDNEKSEDNGDNEKNDDNGDNEKNEELLSDFKVQPTPAQHMAPTVPMQPLLGINSKPLINIGSFDFPSVPAKNDDNEDDDKDQETEPHPYNPAPTPTDPGTNYKISYEDKTSSSKSEENVELSIEQSGKAQKYIKWAGSALNYDDVPTAILNLRKALHLLTTGEDPV